MGSHRRLAGPGPSRNARGSSVTFLSAAAATAAVALAAVPAGAMPLEAPLRLSRWGMPASDAKAAVDRLYRQAERATEAYHRATERVDLLAGRLSDAQDQLARGQRRITTLRRSLGSLAGAQYRTGGVDPALRLLLSARPDSFLEQAGILNRIGARTAGRLTQVRTLQRNLAQQHTEAAHTLARLRASRAAVAGHKRTVERRLAEAKRLLRTLTANQRAAYQRSGPLPRTAAGPGGPASPGGAAFGPGAQPASPRAAAALTAARSALGRPYVWGANGPDGFDCSGLTQWAYGQAGIGLPRTSQEQRYAGAQVPLAQARPGDLVAYRHDASHIAMYAGHGQVIHAPYPGAPVRYDPVGMLPVTSVTRV